MKSYITAFIFAIFFLLSSASDLSAQNYNFKHVEAPLGVSTIILGITQDAKGYIWVASDVGLYRYDGYQFKLYLNDPLNPGSLGSNQLESICTDKNGNIWIGTAGYGLDRFDPVTEVFTHYRHNPSDASTIIHNKITALLQDSDGDLWIGTHGGLDRLIIKTGRFYHYRHEARDPNSLSCDQVRSIYQDHRGTIWIGTGSPFPNDDSGPEDGGLNRFDKKAGKFIRYLHDPKDPHSLISNKVCGMLEDSRGTFWVGTAGDGLHTMDRDKGVFERHLYDPSHRDKLSRPPLPSPASYDHIRFITEDVSGGIWIGTVLAGMNHYDPVTQKAIHCDGTKNSFGLLDNTAWCSFISHEGVLWVGSWNGNLYRTDPIQKDIPFTRVDNGTSVLFEEDSNTLWAGTFDGLINQISKNVVRKISSSNDNTIPKFNGGVSAICKSHDGDLWIGTGNGLRRINKKTNEIARFDHDEKNAGSLSSGPVNDIIEDKKGLLWIATQDGINVMDIPKKLFTHYRHDPEDTGSLSNQWVLELHEDASGNLWAGCYKGAGINLFNKQTGKFKHYLLGLSVFCMFEDADGILWVGTDGGFFRYNRPEDAFVLFEDPKRNIKTGSIAVNAIMEDGKRTLWMSTSLGIIRLNAARNEINIFGRNCGVNAINLGTSCLRSHNGKLYFGGPSGYYSFFPDSISSNSKTPQIVLADFRIGDQSIMPGPKSPLKVPIDEAKKIILNYRQNVFSFDYAGIHYSSPEDNKHLFMLENYDNNWRQSGTEHTAYYYNVPPGHYILRIKTASSNDIWTEKSIAIIITPPWWRTWWAYCLYGILFIIAVYSIHRYQKQRVIKTEREKTRVKELLQAKEIEKAYHELKITQSQLVQQEKMASLGELTAGIAHEIQNPLNFVNNFSEVNTELIEELRMKNEKLKIEDGEVKELLNDIKDNSEKINLHGKRADAIVKGMLQHSRTSTGKKEASDINKLAEEYLRLAYHGLRAKDKSFNVETETDFDSSVGKINIIPQDIGRVFLNLINNAFYAVHERQKEEGDAYKPIVLISTRKIDGKIEIRVSDNGNGMPDSIKEKIFQPFFTTKPTGQGTGLGLSLAYDIIKAHGGEIKVESKEGDLTTFIIQLPNYSS